jgi:hypothetical protein
MLTEYFPLERLQTLKVPCQPFPLYGDRAAWGKLPREITAAWIKTAEEFLEFAWPAMPAEAYLTLGLTGELTLHWRRFCQRRSALGVLALAECMEGRGRFILQIINGILSLCEETSWIQPLAMAPAHYELPGQEDHLVDLCSSETAALLAWTDALLGPALEAVSKRVRPRLWAEVRGRVLDPYLARDDYWWMGFTQGRANNWNPWCNKNILSCLLLLEPDPVRRGAGLHKAVRSLDSYIAAYAPDGCCDEGPMYWGAAGAGLFVCLELLARGTGEATVFREEQLGRIGRYITQAFIHEDWFVNYADGDAHVALGSAAFRFGRAIGDPGMARLGARAPAPAPIVDNWFDAYGYLQEIFTYQERKASQGPLPYPAESWLWHTEVLCARQREGSPEGFFLSVKGGHNGESHNHNDVGNFIVYLDGAPVLIDLGTEEYTAKTFSPQRYGLWYLQSQYHNCPGVRGVLQEAGAEYRAAEVVHTPGAVSMELKHAYPAGAGIRSWRRAAALDRAAGRVVVTDAFWLESPTQDIVRHLITPWAPEQTPAGVALVCAGQTVLLRPEPQADIIIEEIVLRDSRLRKNWGERVYRILLREQRPTAAGEARLWIERG